MRENLIYTIFAVAVIMAFVLAAICLAETMPDSAGKPHPEYLGLQIGGDGSARLEHIGHLGFLFQCLLLVQINLLSLLGVPEKIQNSTTFRLHGREFSLYAYRGMENVLWTSKLPRHSRN